MRNTFSLIECGSVHTNPASINFTRFKPFNFFKHNVNSSLDSNAACIHSAGGCKYLNERINHCYSYRTVITKEKFYYTSLVPFILPFTSPAEMNCRLLWDTFCNVNLRSQTCHAHICWIRFDTNAAEAT